MRGVPRMFSADGDCVCETVLSRYVALVLMAYGGYGIEFLIRAVRQYPKAPECKTLGRGI